MNLEPTNLDNLDKQGLGCGWNIIVTTTVISISLLSLRYRKSIEILQWWGCKKCHHTWTDPKSAVSSWFGFCWTLLIFEWVVVGSMKLLIKQMILVGGLEHFSFFHILGIIIPMDFHTFQRRRYTTNQVPKTLFNGHTTVDAMPWAPPGGCRMETIGKPIGKPLENGGLMGYEGDDTLW